MMWKTNLHSIGGNHNLRSNHEITMPVFRANKIDEIGSDLENDIITTLTK